MTVFQARISAAAMLLVAVASHAVRGDEAPFAALDQRMQQYVDEGFISGAVTLVAEHGQIKHIGAVGLADIATARPMNADTMFSIMSMTKPFAATALMILVDEGKVSLDDPVEKYIQAFADAKLESGEPVQRLTVRRLLSHTSGLVGSQHALETLEATAAELAARPFGYQPGTKWEYGPGLNICGRIVEIASGQPFDEFLAERILKPLAMDDTTFTPTDDYTPRLATIYKISEEDKSLVDAEIPVDAFTKAAPNPSAGLFTTVGELFRFNQMILDGGQSNGQRIVSERAVREMTSVQTPDLVTGFTPGNGWGLGWCIVREPQGVTAALSPGTFGHGGAWGTQAWVDPLRERVFILMIQRADIGNGDGSEIRGDFHRLAVEGLEQN